MYTDIFQIEMNCSLFLTFLHEPEESHVNTPYRHSLILISYRPGRGAP